MRDPGWHQPEHGAVQQLLRLAAADPRYLPGLTGPAGISFVLSIIDTERCSSSSISQLQILVISPGWAGPAGAPAVL